MAQKKILIIEDSDPQSRILEHWVTKYGYMAVSARSVSDARRIIAREKIDVALLDWELPDGTGIELINEILSFSPSGWLPIIMVTSHTDSSQIKEAIEAGATDFIRKPADEVELLARIYSALRIKTLQDRLLESSHQDPLTSLYNRRYMSERIEQEFQRCRRHDRPISLAMIDIDFFKNVNDTYGHDVGDTVLRLLANELKLQLRKSDIVSRYGGEEFVILLPETTLENAHLVLDKIRNQISNILIPIEDSPPFSITFSGGIAGGSLAPEMTPADALKIADKHLYEAKLSGRNQIVSKT